jgi:signal peptide peptidase SppA
MKRPAPAVYKPTGNGVAIVEIRGTLSKYERYGFGPSTIMLTDLIQRATIDPSVKTIILWIDSPGGEVAGTIELANAVQDATKSKPVFAMVDGLCASAAYLVASQATKIFVTTHMDLIGSMAVFMLSIDSSRMLDQLGIKVIRIRSGDLKGIGNGVAISDDERDYLQSLVDQQAEAFASYVAAGRGKKRSDVQPLMTGAIWTATEAGKLGLIDGISSIKQLIRDSLGPDLKLAQSAMAFQAIIDDLMADGYSEVMAMRTARSKGSAFSAEFDKFQSLPEWRRRELLNVVKGGLK